MWQIDLLGGLRAVRGDRVITHFRTQKVGALLAYLAFYPERVHSRGELVELLWPECDPEAGRLRLRVTLASLRQVLEPRLPGASVTTPNGGVLIADRATVRLGRGECLTDVAQFEADIQAACRGDARIERRRGRLETALERYRGELLPGHFEAWIFPERQRLTELFLQVLGELVALLVAAGDHSAALPYARRAVATDPLREEARHELIRLLAAAGQHPAALREYDELEQLLKREWGVAPSPEIRRLICELKARGGEEAALLLPPEYSQKSSPPAEASLPPSFTRFFGREREIARLNALLGQGIEAKASGTEGSQSAGPLPSPESCPRLITVTGPGGVGKTRLALEVAARLNGGWGGAVWFVPLADLRAPAQIGTMLSEALGLPHSQALEPLDQVVTFLARRGAGQPLLLVLDNFEQLVAEGVAVVRLLLERVPSLTLLVTSRQRLDLPGEQEFPVGPLPVPDVRRQTRDASKQRPAPPSLASEVSCGESVPSVALFVDRARSVRPDFQVTASNAVAVAQLCARLEGIPLAIELAAARVWVLTPAQMLARLSQRFELLVGRKQEGNSRHRSLRAALEWSYQLLSPELRQFFARLSVFRGGFTLEAAESVWGGSVGRSGSGAESSPSSNARRLSPALDFLEHLREASLVLAEETAAGCWASEVGEGPREPSIANPQPLGPAMRFRLLETLREFGAEQLSRDEHAAAARRHADYYLALAAAAEPQLCGPEQGPWLDRLAAEHDNLRAALAWRQTDEAGAEQELRLTTALIGFWLARGHLSEGRCCLEHALARSDAAGACRARAVRGLAEVALLQGEPHLASQLAEESVALCRQQNDPWELAEGLAMLGGVLAGPGDPTRAAALLEEGCGVARGVGNTAALARALFNLAYGTWCAGDRSRAIELLEESRALSAALGDRMRRVNSTQLLGLFHLWQGDYQRATAILEEQLALSRRAKDRLSTGYALWALGSAALREGDFERAAALLEESLALRREIGHRIGIVESLTTLGVAAAARSDYTAARAQFEEALALRREMGNPQELALSLCRLGCVMRQPGEAAEARRLLEDGVALSRRCGGRSEIAAALYHLAGFDYREGRFAAACDGFAESLALCRELGDKGAILQRLEAMAAATPSHPEQAVRLLGGAQAWRQALGPAAPLPEPPGSAADLAALYAALDEASFTAAWAAGAADEGLPPATPPTGGR